MRFADVFKGGMTAATALQSHPSRTSENPHEEVRRNSTNREALALNRKPRHPSENTSRPAASGAT